MKKNFILILVFIGMFFIGEIKADAALTCKVGDKDCTFENIFNQKDIVPVCLYEVKVDKGLFKEHVYYNYIYYHKEAFYGGTTFGDTSLSTGFDAPNPKKLEPEKNISTAAYNNLKGGICPQKSFIDNQWFYEICFDNGNGDCVNTYENNAATDYNFTIDSSLVGDYGTNIKYFNVSIKNACDIENLSLSKVDGYNKVCRYSTQKDDSFILVYYNDAGESAVLYNDLQKGNKYLIRQNQEVKVNAGRGWFPKWWVLTYQKTEKYSNQMSAIKSCPSKVYLYEEEADLSYTGVSGKEILKGWLTMSTSPATAPIFSTVSLIKDYPVEEIKNVIISDQALSLTGTKTTYNNLKCGFVFEPTPDPKTCGELIPEEIRNIINNIMDIIKIAIPILLLGLIIFDFATAIFSESEEKMNKAKGKVIKRIIVAIVIFFVPTLVNLLFDLVNNIWGTNFETSCITEEKTN